MPVNKELAIQQRLGSEKEGTYYVFPEGTGIWPEGWGSGYWTVSGTGGLQAEKLKDERVRAEGRDIQAWRAEKTARLYRDREYRSLVAGGKFGAYTSNAVKRKIISK